MHAGSVHEALIALKDLRKFQDGQARLEIDRLEVEAGEIAVVAGPAGSGKSVLLELLTGQVRPSAGTVRVANLVPYEQRRVLGRQVGLLSMSNGLYERLSARTNLVFFCRIWGLPESYADQVLAQVGLADSAQQRAARMSSSMARCLAFGRAILHNPQVLLLVEPFHGCNPASVVLLGHLIEEQASMGTAVLILATEVGPFNQICRTVYILEAGRLVRSYNPQEESRIDLAFKVPARQEGQVVLVNPADILYVAAGEGQSRLYTLQGPIDSHLTLSELAGRLSRNGFFRAHRGYLVNLQRVKAIIPYTRDSYTLVLDNSEGTEIPLSKSAARELRELLGY